MDNRVLPQEKGFAETLVEEGKGLIDNLRNTLGGTAIGAAFLRKYDTEKAGKELVGVEPVQAPSNTLRNWGINRLPERLKEMGME